ncbi:MAG: hypothetical protein E7633_03530 [Ruminococcaceae bacterium]|nr:hypothetical protein [Oscillospiraceae bacterium]
MFFFKSKACRELDNIINDIDQYLMNNYKDLAHDARLRLEKRTEELFSEGKLNEKQHHAYMLKFRQYSYKMRDYHH